MIFRSWLREQARSSKEEAEKPEKDHHERPGTHVNRGNNQPTKGRSRSIRPFTLTNSLTSMYLLHNPHTAHSPCAAMPHTQRRCASHFPHSTGLPRFTPASCAITPSSAESACVQIVRCATHQTSPRAGIMPRVAACRTRRNVGTFAARCARAAACDSKACARARLPCAIGGGTTRTHSARTWRVARAPTTSRSSRPPFATAKGPRWERTGGAAWRRLHAGDAHALIAFSCPPPHTNAIPRAARFDFGTRGIARSCGESKPRPSERNPEAQIGEYDPCGSRIGWNRMRNGICWVVGQYRGCRYLNTCLRYCRVELGKVNSAGVVSNVDEISRDLENKKVGDIRHK